MSKIKNWKLDIGNLITIIILWLIALFGFIDWWVFIAISITQPVLKIKNQTSQSTGEGSCDWDKMMRDRERELELVAKLKN
jgi:hypothetical protein